MFVKAQHSKLRIAAYSKLLASRNGCMIVAVLYVQCGVDIATTVHRTVYHGAVGRLPASLHNQAQLHRWHEMYKTRHCKMFVKAQRSKLRIAANRKIVASSNGRMIVSVIYSVALLLQPALAY